MIVNPCILTDVTKCIGCEECVVACKKINELPADDPPPRPGDRAGLRLLRPGPPGRGYIQRAIG